MTALRQRMIEDLTVRNFARRTVDCYVGRVARFAQYFGQSPDRLGPEDIRRYLVFLQQEKQVSWTLFNQTVCALRFFYQVTAGKPWYTVRLDSTRLSDAVVLAVRHEQYLALDPDQVFQSVGKPFALIDCFCVLNDAQIRRYFELGCEVKGLGRGHVKRIKDEVRSRTSPAAADRGSPPASRGAQEKGKNR